MSMNQQELIGLLCKSKKAPLPKICHTYPKSMKFGTVIPDPKKIQKIWELRDAPRDFC